MELELWVDYDYLSSCWPTARLSGWLASLTAACLSAYLSVCQSVCLSVSLRRLRARLTDEGIDLIRRGGVVRVQRGRCPCRDPEAPLTNFVGHWCFFNLNCFPLRFSVSVLLAAGSWQGLLWRPRCEKRRVIRGIAGIDPAGSGRGRAGAAPQGFYASCCRCHKMPVITHQKCAEGNWIFHGQSTRILLCLLVKNTCGEQVIRLCLCS